MTDGIERIVRIAELRAQLGQTLDADLSAKPLRVFHVLGLYKPMWFATVDGMVATLVREAERMHALVRGVVELRDWAKNAPLGAMLDGWYEATWVFVLDGNSLDLDGRWGLYELEDEPDCDSCTDSAPKCDDLQCETERAAQ